MRGPTTSLIYALVNTAVRFYRLSFSITCGQSAGACFWNYGARTFGAGPKTLSS